MGSVTRRQFELFRYIEFNIFAASGPASVRIIEAYRQGATGKYLLLLLFVDYLYQYEHQGYYSVYDSAMTMCEFTYLHS